MKAKRSVTMVGLIAVILVGGCYGVKLVADGEGGADVEAVSEEDVVLVDSGDETAGEGDATDAEAGGEVVVCYFASGRPCVGGRPCFSEPGGSCFLSYCEPASHEIRAAPCLCPTAGTGDPGPAPDGAPFTCDPAELTSASNWRMCCGGWRTLHQAGSWECVRIEFCEAIPCDPTYSDSCPWDYVCDALSRSCVAP